MSSEKDTRINHLENVMLSAADTLSDLAELLQYHADDEAFLDQRHRSVRPSSKRALFRSYKSLVCMVEKTLRRGVEKDGDNGC